MYTLEQLTAALPALQTSFQQLDNVESLSIKWVSPTNVDYTDGEANGAIAHLVIGRKNLNHVSGCLDKPKIEHCSMYIFPNGRVMSHFMKWSPEYTNTSDYVTRVKEWLITIE